MADFLDSSHDSSMNSSTNEQLACLTTSVGGKDGQFDIRNHLDKLTPVKNKNRYECPICGGDNLTLDPSTGKYQCWNYEGDKKHLAEIREFLSPWNDKIKGNGNTHPLPQRQSKPKLLPPNPAKIPDTPIKLARFPQAQIITNGIGKTEYPYGNDRVVIRIDKPDGEKICFPMTNGVKGKPDKAWNAYREPEVLQFGKGQWVLGVEGEKCVESSRGLGIVSWTMQASDWRENLDNPSHFALLMAMLRFKQAEVAGIVYFPDNDATGFKKAQTVSIACAMSGMPCIILDPLQIDPDAVHGWDVADWAAESISSAGV